MQIAQWMHRVTRGDGVGFRGIVLTVDDGAQNSNKYTVCDFGFYLNKSKETYQFNDMEVRDLFTKICSDFNIDIDSICDIPQKITKIYLDKTISDIIKDVLSQCGGDFNFDVTPKGLRVYRVGDLVAYPEFRLSPNTQLNYSPALRGGVSHSTSIEDMKNSVKVVSGDEKGFTVITAEQDAGMIHKYGLLQEVVKIDPDKTNPYTVAREKLAELAQVKENFSFEMIEALDSYTRAGMVIDVDGVMFVIEGSQHCIRNGIHYTKLDLRRTV